MTDDLRRLIPECVFLNAVIIDCAVKTDAFAECQTSLLKKVGYRNPDGYHYKNPAFLAGFLYCLIVVPHETWDLPKDHDIYQQLESKELLSLFEIKIRDKKYPDSPMYGLIYHLRNAVAHAHFSIDQSQAFTFWDKLPLKEAPLNWQVWISNPNLMTFLNGVAHVFLPNDPLRR